MKTEYFVCCQDMESEKMILITKIYHSSIQIQMEIKCDQMQLTYQQ